MKSPRTTTRESPGSNKDLVSPPPPKKRGGGTFFVFMKQAKLIFQVIPTHNDGGTSQITLPGPCPKVKYDSQVFRKMRTICFNHPFGFWHRFTQNKSKIAGLSLPVNKQTPEGSMRLMDNLFRKQAGFNTTHPSWVKKCPRVWSFDRTSDKERIRLGFNSWDF